VAGRIAKLVAGNLLVLLVIIWSLNLLSSIALDGEHVVEQWFVPPSDKADSPSLSDRQAARTIFHEFSLLRTRYVPYLAWSREPFEGEYTHVDETGDRVHTPTTDRPRGRVHFFGGSTIWGKGVGDEETIPALFNRLHPDHAVYNHGESGFVSRQSLARLVNLRNQDTEMDLVVFYDGCNDVYTLCRSDVSINGHSREHQIARKLRPSSHTLQSLVGPLREVIVFLRTSLGSRRHGPSACQEDPAYAQRVAETMVNNWRIARTLALDAGADFHAILQPLAPIGRPSVDYLRDTALVSSRSVDYSTVYPLVQEIILRESAPWLHDFTDSFDVDEYIYIDDCHVNARGNEIIARRVDDVAGAALAP